MSLTPRQITLIQNNFKKVEPIADTAAEIFYTKLFKIDPSLRRLFKKDMKKQGQMLMSVLKAAVNGLNDLNKIVPVLHSLAERHIDYGVKVEDYTAVGNALLFTLKQGLGNEFTAEHRKAWIAVYNIVAETMRSHSYPNYDAKTFVNRKHYNKH